MIFNEKNKLKTHGKGRGNNKERDEKTNPGVEEICEATWREIYGFIYYKVQNKEEAEDITQEAYAKTLAYLKREHRPIESYIGFLKRVSLNIMKDRWRGQKRYGNNLDIDYIDPEEYSTEDFSNTMANRYFIEDALNSLTKDYRTVIELRIIKGYSVAQAAKIMGKKEGTIRVMQHRALKELSGIFDENW